MKIILPLFLLVLLASFPVMAEEPATGAESVPAKIEVPAETLELAKQMHEIWPIRTRVEYAIETVSEKFPPDPIAYKSSKSTCPRPAHCNSRR